AIDTIEKSLTLSLGDTLVRKAKYYGDQGCIICRNNKDSLNFTPTTITSALPPAESMAWPMGDMIDEVTDNDLSSEIIEKALDAAFIPEDGLTAAMVIIKDGKLIGERYMSGIGYNTQLESWSMGKSLTATLTGRMIQMGYYGMDDEKLFPEWSNPEDPRSKISVRNLLQMSSGLKFSSHRDPGKDMRSEALDHFYIYTGAIDAFDFSINRPLEFEVGSMGRYRNCDPLSLGKLIRDHLEADGQEYLSFPQRALFDKIGIRKQVLETDPYGNFLLTGYDYGTARNWARLGMLYLQDGVWNDERLLPEGFVGFVSAVAESWEEPVYGGQFWVNGTGDFPIPTNSYAMMGAGGQRTIIIPDYNMVVVRMGHFRGSETGGESLNNALKVISDAMENN
ncbi:MAG: serine hydrolase, partial [Saprospiraceae bacterium]|nr:serine hydrolase [Saprospiraceae bacterium]